MAIKAIKACGGQKPKNGTSWGHSFFTLELVGTLKLTYDIVSVNALNKDYTALFEAVINRLKGRGLEIKPAFWTASSLISPLSGHSPAAGQLHHGCAEQ